MFTNKLKNRVLTPLLKNHFFLKGNRSYVLLIGLVFCDHTSFAGGEEAEVVHPPTRQVRMHTSLSIEIQSTGQSVQTGAEGPNPFSLAVTNRFKSEGLIKPIARYGECGSMDADGLLKTGSSPTIPKALLKKDQEGVIHVPFSNSVSSATDSFLTGSSSGETLFSTPRKSTPRHFVMEAEEEAPARAKVSTPRGDVATAPVPPEVIDEEETPVDVESELAEGAEDLSPGMARAEPTLKAKVLSMDGGGFRGLLPAAMIYNIQNEFKVDLPGTANIMAGTSAGALNTLGYAIGLNPAEVVEFYREEGDQIFKKSHGRKFLSMGGLFKSRYSRKSLDDLLERQFAGQKLSEVRHMNDEISGKLDVVIPALNITAGRPEVYSSRRARENPMYDYRLRDVAAATTAAPTFFSPASFEGPDGAQKYMADGGLFANNPIMAAMGEIKELGYDINKAVVVSLGTGEVNLGRDGSALKSAGAMKWGPGNMIKLMMAAGQKYTHQTAQGVFGSNYLRLQPQLDESRAAMDKTDDAQRAYLIDLGARMIDDNFDRVENIVRRWDAVD